MNNNIAEFNPRRQPYPFKLISLSCGAGGLDIGFHQAGFKTVWGNDCESKVKESYYRG